MIWILLLYAQPSGAPPIESCSANGAKFIASSEGVWRGLAKAAGLSDAGREAYVRLSRDDALAIWCGPVRSESDLARERLLSALAEDKLNPEKLVAAQQAEVAANIRDEQAGMTRLISILTSLPDQDRRKLAAWLRDDLKRRWARQERTRGQEK